MLDSTPAQIRSGRSRAVRLHKIALDSLKHLVPELVLGFRSIKPRIRSRTNRPSDRSPPPDDVARAELASPRWNYLAHFRTPREFA